MAIDILMPVITGAGADAVVTAWMVDEGGRVTAGQLIAEVQAEKVAEEVHAPAAGVVTGLTPIGQPVPQGAPMCTVADDGEAAATAAPPPVPAARPAGADAIPASPAAKRLARELGVDLTAVAGSGPGGRITEADVRSAADGGGIPLSGLRAVIARNLRDSVRTTAPVTLTTVVDVTDRLTDRVTARIVRAVATSLRDHPALRGTRDGDRFIPARRTDIAVAVQTGAGLVAPVVRDPAATSLEVVAKEIESLAERARTGTLTPADYDGACFTVTNLGRYGIDAFTPIINPPQIAILGVGAIRTVLALGDAGLHSAKHMVLSLTFDHSFLDGAPAAEFLADLRARLEAPGD